MDYLTTSVITDDHETRKFLVWLLEFVGEHVVSESGDIIVIGRNANGEWPSCERSNVPVIAVGDGDDPQIRNCAGRLDEPLTAAKVTSALHRAYSMHRQEHADPGAADARFNSLVGISDSMVQARSLMAKVANNDATVLITGESGTGKEVVARALHEASRRRDGPFVPINCGAIPADLLESELFGHERGAFTGALTAKAGRFELASGGTLFLDEIGDMPFPMQVKVLRTLQDRSFERVGGTQTLHSDVRIVAATHRVLEDMIHEGSFREDLYYRLNVFPIHLAPLRDRVEDIPMLVSSVSERIRAEQGLAVRLTVDALNVLAHYGWPGNVRELKNLLERLAIQFPNELVASGDLPAKLLAGERVQSDPVRRTMDLEAPALLPVNGVDLKEYLARLERSLIEQALEDTDSVVARAADRLHIRRTTLVEKMRKYGIERG